MFGNTPLEAPILDVLNCVVLMKIQSIQNGLTFVNEHARVQFPRVDNSSLNVLESSGPVQSPSNAASSSLLDIINSLIEKWDTAIRQQAVLASILMGLARVIYTLHKEERSRAEGGGFSSLRTQGIAWVRARVQVHPNNPFEDSRFEQEPGPTPSGRPKQ